MSRSCDGMVTRLPRDTRVRAVQGREGLSPKPDMHGRGARRYGGRVGRGGVPKRRSREHSGQILYPQCAACEESIGGGLT